MAQQQAENSAERTDDEPTDDEPAQKKRRKCNENPVVEASASPSAPSAGTMMVPIDRLRLLADSTRALSELLNDILRGS